MANGISKNPLTDISKVYLTQIAEGGLKNLEKASVLAMSDDPKDQDKAREIKTRFDYQSLMKQRKAKKAVKEEDHYGQATKEIKRTKLARDQRFKSLHKSTNTGSNVDVNEDVKRDEYGDPIGGPKISKKQKAKNLKANTPDEQHTTTTSEAFSDWRHDLREIISADEASDEPEIKEKKVKNKIKINPEFKEAVEELGGELLEVQEMDPKKQEQIKRKEKMLKKKMLRMKLRAVNQTGGEDIVAGYEPEGEQIDELSKNTTANYLYRARVDKDFVHSNKMGKYQKARDKGIKRAEKKLGKKVSDRLRYVAKHDSDSMRQDSGKSEYPRKIKVKEEVITERQKDSDNQRLSQERGRSNYGKASIRNVRATGTGGNAADPAERLVAMDARHKAHKAKRGVKTKGMKEETLDEKCWKGYTKKGMKTMFGKRYPNCVKKEEVEVDEATRYAKETGKSFKSGKPVVKGGTAKDDKAFQVVAKKYASQMMGGPQKKKVRGQKPDESNTPFKRAAARIKQIKIDNKALADKAKKAGYKSTQDYVNVQAVRKGGLGT